ncbi:MAG: MBL fold metallo-hydrolase [Thermoplasmatota archaeon]
MQVTVCGNARRYLAPFSEGSAYVVDTGHERIVVDAGQGTLARIAAALEEGPPPDAVVLSHFHFDHSSDIVGLVKVLRRGTPLFVPPMGRDFLDHLAAAYHFRGTFDLPGALVEARAGTPYALGATTLRFAPTEHSCPGVAVACEAGGKRIVLASDSAPCPTVRELAADADLLVCHTLLPTADPNSHHVRVHATGRTAGALARDAGVKDLLLSHLFHQSDPTAVAAVAAGAFGAVTIAETGRSYMV